MDDQEAYDPEMAETMHRINEQLLVDGMHILRDGQTERTEARYKAAFEAIVPPAEEPLSFPETFALLFRLLSGSLAPIDCPHCRGLMAARLGAVAVEQSRRVRLEHGLDKPSEQPTHEGSAHVH